MRLKVFRLIGILLLIFILGFVFFFYSFVANKYYSTLIIRFNKNEVLSNFLIGRMIVLIIINFLLVIGTFLISKKVYFIVCVITALSGLSIWILRYLYKFFLVKEISFQIKLFFEFILLLSYSIIAPLISLIIVYYIQKLTPVFDANLFGKYHIHESFFGLILIFVALIIFVIRQYATSYDVLWNELKLFLAIINVSLFFFIYFGCFFLFRDIHDIFAFKFIEKNQEIQEEKEDKKQEGRLFPNIREENLPFFKKPFLVLYPLGMFFMNFSFTMIIYGSDFLPFYVFHLSYNSVVVIGLFICGLSGALIGLDWFKMFKFFYPELYLEVDKEIKQLKKDSRKVGLENKSRTKENI
jgi:hypothetical protein